MRAGQIRQAVESRDMPPWKPVNAHGVFEGERSLTDTEIETISHWVADGAPEGAPSVRVPRLRLTGLLRAQPRGDVGDEHVRRVFEVGDVGELPAVGRERHPLGMLPHVHPPNLLEIGQRMYVCVAVYLAGRPQLSAIRRHAEAVRGRGLSIEQRMKLSQVGFIIVIAIMVWAVANDVLRLFGM